MILAAAAAGAVWAGIAAVLRLWVDINEAVTTLLLNYVAIDLLGFLIYSTVEGRQRVGAAATTPILAVAARLPLIGTSRVHIGIVIAVVARRSSPGCLLKRTSWGFRLGSSAATPRRPAGPAAGRHPAAQRHARRRRAGRPRRIRPATPASSSSSAGLPAPPTATSASSPAGWPGTSPSAVAVAAILLSAIAIGGDSLQIDSGLPAASVNILMALVLLAVFGWTQRKRQRSQRHEPASTSSPVPCAAAPRSSSPALGETDLRARRRGEPRHRGLDAVRCPRRLRGHGRDAATRGSGSLAGARRRWAARARPRLLRASTGAPTSWPPAWSCCSSGSASRRCSARPTCRPTSTAFESGRHPDPLEHPVDRRDLLPAGPADLPLLPARSPACWWLLFRSRWGVLLRAAGERSRGAHHLRPPGWSASSTSAVIAGGMLAGIGGAQLSIAYTNAWFENMIQGRGFIAVAVVIFAARQPFKVAAGSYLFGAALALSPGAPGRGLQRSTSSPSTSIPVPASRSSCS